MIHHSLSFSLWPAPVETALQGEVALHWLAHQVGENLVSGGEDGKDGDDCGGDDGVFGDDFGNDDGVFGDDRGVYDETGDGCGDYGEGANYCGGDY